MKKLFPGLTYYDKQFGFSLNEGAFPNLTVRWSGDPIGFYIGICPQVRIYWFKRE